MNSLDSNRSVKSLFGIPMLLNFKCFKMDFSEFFRFKQVSKITIPNSNVGLIPNHVLKWTSVNSSDS